MHVYVPYMYFSFLFLPPIDNHINYVFCLFSGLSRDLETVPHHCEYLSTKPTVSVNFIAQLHLCGPEQSLMSPPPPPHTHTLCINNVSYNSKRSINPAYILKWDTYTSQGGSVDVTFPKTLLPLSLFTPFLVHWSWLNTDQLIMEVGKGIKIVYLNVIVI